MEKDIISTYFRIDESSHQMHICILVKSRIVSNAEVDITVSDITINEKIRDSDNGSSTIIMENTSRIIVGENKMLPIDEILKQTALILADMKNQSGIGLYLAKPIKITIKNMNNNSCVSTTIKFNSDTAVKFYSLINHRTGDILNIHIDYSIN
jgi:hypothetical protein